MLPSVKILKNQSNIGSVPPSPTGVLAIVASSFTGTQNQPAGFARDDLMLTAFGGGPLAEYGSYTMQVSGKPVVGVRCTASVAGTAGSITASAQGGTSAVTNSASVPVDEYDALLTIVAGGTIGVAGITYTTSLDGGDSTTAVQALGTANSLTIGNTGVTYSFGAGTLAAGATYQFFTTRPQPNNTDLPASFNAIAQTRIPWEAVYFDCVYGTGTVGQIDVFLEGLEAKGMFKLGFLNTRHKNQPVSPPPGVETEATFLTAMTNLTSQDSSFRLCVGTDAGDYTSTLTGVSQPRPVGLAAAARAMLVPVGEDLAFVGRGPIPGFTLADGNNNPRWHDEDLFPGLDDLRLTTFRTFAQPEGPQGVFLTNGKMFSSTGSDFVFVQHARCMNVACGSAWAILTRILGIGVSKLPPDPTTGLVYIAPQDAQMIDGLVNASFVNPLKKQVVGVDFELSQTDDLSPNTGATVNGTINLVALAYLKGFEVVSQFSKDVKVRFSG